RGLSELEKGGDGWPGKKFWLSNGIGSERTRGAGGVVGRLEESSLGQSLTVAIHVEPFSNGARPIVEITFFERLPDRMRFRTFAAAGGKPMKQCVLTAT